MIFRWLEHRRRRRLLATPFPDAWEPIVETLPCFATLDEHDRARLRDIARVIVAEKQWTGCAGLAIDDVIRVTIAAQAALLLVGLEHDYYRGVESIVVYPHTFEVPTRGAGPGGLAIEGKSAVLGLAHHGGTIVLAWDAVYHGAENFADGRNVVIHEFAHALDLLDAWADGTPPLRNREQYDAWIRILGAEYERLVDHAERGRRAVLDSYGATNPAEFFAVATEAFFEKPRQLEREHGELYALLTTYYGQDPAARVDPARRPTQ